MECWGYSSEQEKKHTHRTKNNFICLESVTTNTKELGTNPVRPWLPQLGCPRGGWRRWLCWRPGKGCQLCKDDAGQGQSCARRPEPGQGAAGKKVLVARGGAGRVRGHKVSPERWRGTSWIRHGVVYTKFGFILIRKGSHGSILR